ncbi:MAG: hypothetical protein MJ252_05255 [archaeon]|nr:hypothetical protein [archaeon]
MDIKTGTIHENNFQSIESNKIQLLMPFTNKPNSQAIKFVKDYVTKTWNLCGLLNYKGLKDTENNFFLLRVKDFLLDLFLTIFTKVTSDISLQDIFNLMRYISDVGGTWLSNEELSKNSLGVWVAKVESLMKTIIGKVNEIEALVNLDKRFYKSLFDYINFYFKFFIFNKDVSNLPDARQKEDELENILTMIKNVKFLQNTPETKIFVINLMKAIAESDPSRQKNIFQSFDKITYKNNLPKATLPGIYRLYVKFLLKTNDLNKCEQIIQYVFQFTERNSKEELDFFIFNFYLLNQKGEDAHKIKDTLEKVLDHPEITYELLDKLLINVTNYNCNKLFLECFIPKLGKGKNNKFNNSKIIFNYETLSSQPNFVFSFLYVFFEYILEYQNNIFYNKNEDEDMMDEGQNDADLINNQNLFEFLKNVCEGFLDNIASKVYSDGEINGSNYKYLIPMLLNNIITFFVKFEGGKDGFANYFLIEIIKKLKDTDKNYSKQFMSIATDIYIKCRDLDKLKTILSEMEKESIQTDAYYYSKIILLIGEGLKWGSISQISQLCEQTNKMDNFDIDLYPKLLGFAYQSKIQDVNLYGNLLKYYTQKFIEMYNKKKLKYSERLTKAGGKEKNIFTLIDCYYEAFFYCSKLSGFFNQIATYSECLELLSDFLEKKVFDPKNNSDDKGICSSLENFIPFITLLIEIKSNKNFNTKNFPEYFLTYYSKIVSFFFVNFNTYFEKEFMKKYSSPYKNEDFSALTFLFEAANGLKLFTATYQYNSILNDSDIDDNKRKKMYKEVLQTLNYNTQLLSSSFDFVMSKMTNPADENIKIAFTQKIGSLFNSTKTVEQILIAQLTILTETEENILGFINNALNEDYKNKKYIFTINSLLFQNGKKNLCYMLLNGLIPKIMNTNRDELFFIVYFTDDIANIFEDLISLSDDNFAVMSQDLDTFINFINGLKGKVEDNILDPYAEWIFYVIYENLNEFKNLNMTEEIKNNILTLKGLYGKVSHFKERSCYISSIGDIIIEELNNLGMQ